MTQCSDPDLSREARIRDHADCLEGEEPWGQVSHSPTSHLAYLSIFTVPTPQCCTPPTNSPLHQDQGGQGGDRPEPRVRHRLHPPRWRRGIGPAPPYPPFIYVLPFFSTCHYSPSCLCPFCPQRNFSLFSSLWTSRRPRPSSGRPSASRRPTTEDLNSFSIRMRSWWVSGESCWWLSGCS